MASKAPHRRFVPPAASSAVAALTRRLERRPRGAAAAQRGPRLHLRLAGGRQVGGPQDVLDGQGAARHRGARLARLPCPRTHHACALNAHSKGPPPAPHGRNLRALRPRTGPLGARGRARLEPTHPVTPRGPRRCGVCARTSTPWRTRVRARNPSSTAWPTRRTRVRRRALHLPPRRRLPRGPARAPRRAWCDALPSLPQECRRSGCRRPSSTPTSRT